MLVNSILNPNLCPHLPLSHLTILVDQASALYVLTLSDCEQLVISGIAQV